MAFLLSSSLPNPTPLSPSAFPVWCDSLLSGSAACVGGEPFDAQFSRVIKPPINMSSDGPGRMTRRSSSSRDARKNAVGPYARDGSGAGSTGLTSYMGNVGLDFKEEGGEEEEDDFVGELKDIGKPKHKKGLASKALGAISFRKGKSADASGSEPGTLHVQFTKPTDVTKPIGITFNAPDDQSHKGVVVSIIHDGMVAAKAKVLHVGDVVHAINGVAVTTPQQAADELRKAHGTVKVTLTRAAAAPKDHRKSGMDFSGMLSFAHGKGKNKSPPHPAAAKSPPAAQPAPSAPSAPSGPSGEAGSGAAEDDPSTTVVVSCSQLIVESKKIVGSSAGLDGKLDELFAALKAKEVPSNKALATLVELVGQTTVEQAGLVIANAQKGALADGWVEYLDQGSNKYYYYNVHTKATTWSKPSKPKAPPAPPPQPPAWSAAATKAKAMEVDSDASERSDSARSSSRGAGPVRHGVSDAIAARATKQKMVEAVQLECSLAPRHGPAGLMSVRL